jgi:hypothetical protein
LRNCGGQLRRQVSPTVWRGVGFESNVGWTQNHIERSRAGRKATFQLSCGRVELFLSWWFLGFKCYISNISNPECHSNKFSSWLRD